MKNLKIDELWMFKFIKRKVKNYLLKNGYYIRKSTDRAELVDLFKSLFPVETNHALVRIGGESDGGYLVPDDLCGIKACFSPGVSDVADFEFDLSKKGIRSYLADYSVDAPPIKSEYFDFEKKFIGNCNNDVFMTLESWIAKKKPDAGDLILQMDIEGGEYAALLDTPRSILRKFRIMVIEFHSLEGLLESSRFEIISPVFKKIVQDFEVVHIHPNNYSSVHRYNDLFIPQVMEFTFLRKDRVSWRISADKFPHQLDRKNDPKNPDILLPKNWYQQ